MRNYVLMNKRYKEETLTQQEVVNNLTARLRNDFNCGLMEKEELDEVIEELNQEYIPLDRLKELFFDYDYKIRLAR